MDIPRLPARPDDATRDRIDEAAILLGQAFAEYPEFVHALPDRVRRHAGLMIMWRAVGRQVAAAPHGAVELATRDGMTAGAAVWCESKGAEIGLLGALAQGHLRFGLTAGVRDALGLMKVQDTTMRRHHELMPDEHLYLMGLGVRPGLQGQGIGGELVGRFTDAADRAGLPAFLETLLPENVRLYQRHGFEVVDERPINGLATTFMARPAS